MVTDFFDPDSTEFSRPLLARSKVISHEGRQWTCVFAVDQYWFAVPLGHVQAAAQWRSSSPEESTHGLNEVDHNAAVVECLRQATPTQAERAQLCDGVSTGISALDVLAPLGRGQSLLICGSVGSGKSTLACDVVEQLLNVGKFDKVVRFCTDADTPAFGARLQHQHVYAELAVLPGSGASEGTLLGHLIEAIAAAEATRDAGGHSLLVLDTLAPMTAAWGLAVEWSEAASGTSLNPESISGQRRSFFSNIFERAANLDRGGSLTLLAVVDTDAFAAVGPSDVDRKAGLASSADKSQTSFTVSDFAGRKESDVKRIQLLQDRGVALTAKTLAAIGIAPPAHAAKACPVAQHSVVMRELQSISDGQVVLDKSMAAAGAFPSIVPGTSFSRFGLGSTESSSGGSKPVQRDVRPTALTAVAAHLRVELALEHDTRFRPPVAGEASANTVEAMDADIAQSTRMEAVRAALLQPLHTHMQVEEMVTLLLASCSGAFDALPREKVVELLRGGSQAPFLQYMHSSAPHVLSKLKEQDRVSTEVARELNVAVRLFVALETAQ